jgi:hypothetical protein
MVYPPITQQHTMQAIENYVKCQDIVMNAYIELLRENPGMGDAEALRTSCRSVMTGTLTTVAGIPTSEHRALMANGAWIALIDSTLDLYLSMDPAALYLSDDDDN